MNVIRYKVTTNGGVCRPVCNINGRCAVGSIFCKNACLFNNGRYREKASGFVFCSASNGNRGGIRKGSFILAHSTHVRKFGGVWYQLVKADDISCRKCFFNHKIIKPCKFDGPNKNHECISRFHCKQGIFKDCGGYWKEICQI